MQIWGGAYGYRSTTGVLIKLAGLRIMAVSNTQPGLPALSSGESELGSFCRGCTEGLCVKNVAQEMGLSLSLGVGSDATAAFEQCSKSWALA